MRKSKPPAKRKARKKRAPTLRAAGVASLLLAGVAPAGASGSSADIPVQNVIAPLTLIEEEIVDGSSLSTFTVDKENVRSPHGLTKVAHCRGCGCSRCGSGYCRSYCRSYCRYGS